MHQPPETFYADVVAILKADGISGIEKIAAKLRPLLTEPRFAAAAFADETARKRILFHDPETGVYIQAHLHEGGKRGKPHSHGASWAIYGTIRGSTKMTEWERINPETDAHAELKAVRHYTLGPGDAQAYPPYAIHSTEHPEKAWVIRIVGTDLSAIPRYSFDAAKDRIADG